MTNDPLSRFACRFSSEDIDRPARQKPKLGLQLLKAARQYREALDSAASARRDLIAAVVVRCEDEAGALNALNHLAETFGTPGFIRDDLNR